MKLNVFEFVNRKALRTDLEQFTSGFSQYLPVITDIFRSKAAQKIANRKELQRDLLQEEEDKSESGSLQSSIISDPEMTTEEKLPFMNQFADPKKPLTKEARQRLNESYTAAKQSKKQLGDQTAKDEKALEKEKATAKASFEAQKRRIPKDAADLQAAYGAITEPSAADVEALRDDIKLYHDRANKKPDVPSQAEKDRATKERIIAMGDGDISRGMENAKKVDKALFNDAVAAGVKFEGEDEKTQEAATKVQEMIFGDYRKAVEDANKYSDGEAPPKMAVYAMQWLDRFGDGGIKIDPKVKKRVIESVLENPEGQAAVKELAGKVYGTGGKPSQPAAAGPGVASPGSVAPAGATAVSAGQEADLQGKLSRADAILQKLEEELQLKK